jgi:hypothetical protein
MGEQKRRCSRVMALRLSGAGPMRDIMEWSPLQVRLTMAVANAKYDAFAEAAYRVGELVQLSLMTRADAADLLQEIAEYNQLPFEYGQDRIQRLMADGIALQEPAAA